MKAPNYFLITSILFLITFLKTNAQIDTTFYHSPIPYSEFIKQVGEKNMEYASEKFNINLSEAEIENAKVFPDVELNLAGTGNQKNMGTAFEAGLGWTVELGGKRKARINLAKSEAELTRYLLQNYFHNLKADATLYYLLAIQNKLLLDVQLNSFHTLDQLAKSDSIRFKLGVITRLDARQSRLEAQSMLNDVYAADTEWKNSLVNLTFLVGQKQTDTLWIANGNLSGFERNFNLPDLILTALNNRTDILAALQNKKISQNMLKLAKANRIGDIGINAGIQLNGKATNKEAPSPYHTGFSAGITIPLRFLNNRLGEIQTARYSAQKAETEYKQTELQIQTEVTQAYYNYITSKKQVKQFTDHLLFESESIVNSKIYSYQRGDTSLLEVLNAQRTHNEVQQNYYQTLYNYAATLVELERTAGIWDINF